MHLQVLSWRLSVQRVKPSPLELTQIYDGIAHHWDATLRRWGHDRAYTALCRRLASMLLPSQAEPIAVLDGGIGTGALSLALHHASPVRLDLNGVDLSSQMVAEARQRFAAENVRLQAEVQDLRRLPYADNSFSLVMSAHALEHLPDPQAGLREMARVLRLGGSLLLITTRRNLFGALLDARWGLNRLEPHALRAWLAALGFTKVQFHTLDGGAPLGRWLSTVCTARKEAIL